MEAVPGHTNLFRRGAVYYHRCKVPTDIVETYGRREVTYSLKTRDLAEAVRRVKVASVETMKTFDDHRRKVAAEKAVVVKAAADNDVDPFAAAGEALAANDDEPPALASYSSLSRSQLKLLAELHRTLWLEGDEEARDDRFAAVRPGPGSDMLLFAADEKRLSGKRTHATEYALADSKARAYITSAMLRADLARGDYSQVVQRAGECLAIAGITLDRGSPSWRSLLRLVQAAEVQVMADIQLRNTGGEPDYRGSDEILAEIAASLVPKPVEPIPPLSAISPQPPLAVPVSAAPKLSEVRDQWIAEGKAKEWSPKTAENRITLVDRFIALAGDRPIDGYTKADARHFKEVLSSLPASWWQIDGLHDLGIEAASREAKANGMPPMSITNVNKHIGCLYSLMSYAAKHYDEVDRNPFAGMRVEKKISARDERDPFTLDELRKIFASPPFTGCKSEWLWRQPGDLVLRDSHWFWVPLIALFTGARETEILQLYRDDIVEIDGVPFFDIRAEKPDQRLKNATSKRKIPIHQTLLDIGFADFVAGKTDRLFPNVGMGADGYYSTIFSSKFREFLKSIGVKHSKNSFHSFRHTFEDACRACGIRQEVIDALTGHSLGGMAARYGGKTQLPPLVEAMGMLRYAGLDLSGLAAVPKATDGSE